MSVKKINAPEFQASIAGGVAVVDFNATWCGPCKMLAPVLEELSAEMEGKASFYAMDVDDNPEIASQYNIRRRSGGEDNGRCRILTSAEMNRYKKQGYTRGQA